MNNVMRIASIIPIRTLRTLGYKGFQTFARREMTMPALSPTMDQGNIMKWVKSVGDLIEPGDVLCEVETDKATVGFDSQETGYLAQILKPEGSKGVKVGELVAIVVTKKSELATFNNEQTTTTTPPPIQQTTPPPIQQNTPPKVVLQATAIATKQYPKHSKLGLPALSPTMEKGNLMNWVKREGDKVEPGDILCEIETDKATVGFEVQEVGYLAKILVQAGTKDIPLGTCLGIVVGKKDLIAQFSDYSNEQVAQTSSTASQEVKDQAKPTVEQVAQVPSSATGRVFSSPLARRFAEEKGVELNQVTQRTGIEGSVVKADVVNHLKVQAFQSHVVVQTPVAQTESPKVQVAQPQKTMTLVEQNPYQDVEVSNMRKVIAVRLLESKTTIPHYYLNMKVNMDATLKFYNYKIINRLREELNKVSKVKISVNDFIVKACALALRDVPEVNSQWWGTYIRKFTNADISIAVSTDNGLITPIVFNAGAKGLSAIAENTKALAEKARTHKLKPQEYQGGTFSISNLGMFNIDSFAAVINPPQACILAVGRSAKVVVPGDLENQFKVINQMDATISCDHRVVDGAVGALWLNKFKGYLESPMTMML